VLAPAAARARLELAAPVEERIAERAAHLSRLARDARPGRTVGVERAGLAGPESFIGAGGWHRAVQRPGAAGSGVQCDVCSLVVSSWQIVGPLVIVSQQALPPACRPSRQQSRSSRQPQSCVVP